ncbi:hypothetical protein B6U80_00750 [Candidatus Pacearchaeota archaeon ex4484_26]|nr:MAG: hypothetical protein B6U80_00750 [Candidatus Pacearchaeota archaeon ex4484_26]
MVEDLEQKVKEVNKLSSFLKAFEEKPYDKGVRANLAEQILKNPENPENRGIVDYLNDMPDKDFYGFLQKTIGEKQLGLIKYSKDHPDSLLSKIDDNDLLSLVADTIKPVANEKAKDAHKKYLEAVENITERKVEEMKKYILDKLIKGGYKDTFRAILDDEAVIKMYSGVANGRKSIFASEFAKNGELDRKGLENYAKTNLARAEEQETYNFYLNAANKAVKKTA